MQLYPVEISVPSVWLVTLHIIDNRLELSTGCTIYRMHKLDSNITLSYAVSEILNQHIGVFVAKFTSGYYTDYKTIIIILNTWCAVIPCGR